MDNKGYVHSENEKIFAISRYPSANGLGVLSSENLVNITKGPLFKRIRCYKRLSIFLLLLFLLSLAALIIISCMYINLHQTKLLCNSEECLRSAANMRLSMNLDVDPCEDFYEYTCGRWSSEHPNHGWFPKFSGFESISEKIILAILDFLRSEPKKTEPRPVAQTREFFQSCMDVGSIDEKGYTGLFKYLKEANISALPQLLNVTKTGEESNFDWVQADVTLKKMLSMDVFIGFIVDPNMYNRSQYSIYIGSPGQACPLPSPFRSIKLKLHPLSLASDAGNSTEEEDSEEDIAKEEAHKRIFKKVVNTIYENQFEVPDDEELDKRYEVMREISEEINDLIEELGDSAGEQMPEFFTVDELQNLTDTYLIANNEKPFPIWNDYLKYMFQDVENVTLAFDGSDQLLFDQEELSYMQKIVHFLLKTPSAHIELYVWWVTVYAMIINTTSDISEYVYKQAAPFYAGEVTRPRSLDCAALVTNFMAMAVSYGVADKAFLNTTKPKVQEMLTEIKEVFSHKVRQLKWMDEETKRKTLEKTKNMISFIGFPDWLFEEGAIEIYYEGVEIYPDTFLENMMEMVRTYVPYRLTLLNQKNGRTWSTEPITVNAYNSFTDNSIMIPMAVLSYPVYHLGLESLNYGAIGTILGHELTHGFDNTGRKYDKEGSYNEWWTEKTIKSFENLTECFVNQYNNFSVSSVNAQVKGRRTLGENLADNGGLHHAYVAFKNYQRKHSPEPRLPGFETYTSDQLFFISFGSIWCETTTADTLKFQIEHDEHCPNSLRVFGSLQNSGEFANAFKCPIGSKMNPNRTRCKVW